MTEMEQLQEIGETIKFYVMLAGAKINQEEKIGHLEAWQLERQVDAFNQHHGMLDRGPS